MGFIVEKAPNDQVNMAYMVQILPSFEARLLKETATRISKLAACISLKAFGLAPLASCTMRVDDKSETRIFTQEELRKLQVVLKSLGGVTIVAHMPDTFKSLAMLNPPAGIEKHCRMQIMLSLTSHCGPLDVQCAYVPTETGLKLVFEEVAKTVCEKVKSHIQRKDSQAFLHEIPCLHESDELTKKITMALRDQGIRVIECNMVSPGELRVYEFDNEIECLVTSEYLSQSLRSNDHLMKYGDWKIVSFIQKTETSLKVNSVRVIDKKKL